MGVTIAIGYRRECRCAAHKQSTGPAQIPLPHGTRPAHSRFRRAAAATYTNETAVSTQSTPSENSEYPCEYSEYPYRAAAARYTNETASDPGRPGVALANWPQAGVDGTDGERRRRRLIGRRRRRRRVVAIDSHSCRG
jgi:hypothetical protein